MSVPVINENASPSQKFRSPTSRGCDKGHAAPQKEMDGTSQKWLLNWLKNDKGKNGTQTMNDINFDDLGMDGSRRGGGGGGKGCGKRTKKTSALLWWATGALGCDW